MKNFVSVIVPTYNRAALLPRAVESALAQTHRALEVIVVDDGSTDDTERLARQSWGGEPRVRYLRQENGGVCAARNRALALANGDFIAFLDSDDVWKPWKLELQLAAMRAAPDIGMVWTDMEALGPAGDVVSRRHLKTMYAAWRWFREPQLFDESHPIGDIAAGLQIEAGRLWCGAIYSAMVAGNLVHTSTVLLRRERLLRVGEFDVSFGTAGEDHDFHLRTCREGRVGFIDVPSIYYQTGLPDRLSARSEIMARNYLRTLDRALSQDRDRVDLPLAIIAAAEAGGHAWLASCLLQRGARIEARSHINRSLAFQRFQPRLWAELCLSFAPAVLDNGARRLWATVKWARRSL